MGKSRINFPQRICCTHLPVSLFVERVPQDLTREQTFSRHGKIDPPSMLLPGSARLGSYENLRGKYRRDHLFFSGLASLFLVSVFIGFERSYYLAGLFKAPLPNMLLQVHGAVFSLWVLLLITQTSLVAAKRVDVHRRLGLLGFGLAFVMGVLGVLVASDQIARHAAQPARMRGPWKQGHFTPSRWRNTDVLRAGLLRFSQPISSGGA
jgi:hypothetical protein